MANARNGTIYVGVTNDLHRRVGEHRTGAHAGFTARYGLTRLVYFESWRDISAAVAREKQIKAGPRRRKLALIERENPSWADLAADW